MVSCGYGSVDEGDIQKVAKVVGLPIKFHSTAKKLVGESCCSRTAHTSYRAAVMAVRLVLVSNRQPSAPPLFQKGRWYFRPRRPKRCWLA